MSRGKTDESVLYAGGPESLRRRKGRLQWEREREGGEMGEREREREREGGERKRETCFEFSPQRLSAATIEMR